MGTIGIIFLIGAILLAAAVLPAIGMLFLECAAALFYRRQTPPQLPSPQHHTCVMIPAHNEGASIRNTLQCVIPQKSDGDRVVVIADNCTDDTAAVARGAGAEVIERQNSSHCGKGFALAFGVDYLRSEPPDVVVVVDADTDVEPGTIQAISREVQLSGRPVQAINVLSPPQDACCRDQISAFAFRVRNLVRPMGQARLLQPCQLMGTGMALPWEPLSKMNLASANIVEDMQLGVDFALEGLPAQFSTFGKVTGVLPSSRAAAASQRRRWEHGHLATILQQVPKLMATAVRERRFDLFWLAMDLAVPPLALVVVLWTAMTVMATIAGLTLGHWWPTWIAVFAGAVLIVSVLVSWVRFAKDIPARALVSVPFYVLQKLPIYFGFLIRRQLRWVRTDRV